MGTGIRRAGSGWVSGSTASRACVPPAGGSGAAGGAAGRADGLVGQASVGHCVKWAPVEKRLQSKDSRDEEKKKLVKSNF